LTQDVTNCPQCARRTPAARGECIYCGEALPFARINVAPPQRNIDAADRAFNTILEPVKSAPNESVISQLALALSIEPSEARALTDCNKPIPLARSQTQSEADMIAALVRTCGLRASVISDDELKLDNELLRARHIIILDDKITVLHAAGSVTLSFDEPKLLVLGGLRNTRIDYTEGISGSRGKGGAILDSAEYRTEETMLDCYSTQIETSFRIKSDAFDYSGLVSPLAFRADLNFKEAFNVLTSKLTSAHIDDEFGRVRTLLERAWPARTKNEPRGIKRTGLAMRAVAQATVLSDNRDQFERYSRLMYLARVVRV